MFYVISLLMIFFIFQIQALAQNASSESSSESAPGPLTLPTPLANKNAGRILTEAYRDTFGLLREQNNCSEFFGGPAAAITVLNEFVSKLRKEKLPEYVTVTMSGKTLYVRNIRLGVYFRLFERNLLNENGSFYHRRGLDAEKRIPNVGSFSPATRSARALALLHELGHLIRAPSGDWLIPDDGNDPQRSRTNTETIERVCNVELRTLKRE